MTATIEDALHLIRPGSKWVVSDGSIMIWEGPGAEPTEQEILGGMALYEEMQYVRDRLSNYPSWNEQLERVTKALAYMKSKGIDIGPDGEEQVLEVQKVKDKFPKPSK